MARHTWILNPGPQSVFDQDVAVATAARFHFHSNLSRARLRDIALHQFKIAAGFADLCRFHFLFTNLVDGFWFSSVATPKLPACRSLKHRSHVNRGWFGIERSRPASPGQ